MIEVKGESGRWPRKPRPDEDQPKRKGGLSLQEVRHPPSSGGPGGKRPEVTNSPSEEKRLNGKRRLYEAESGKPNESVKRREEFNPKTEDSVLCKPGVAVKIPSQKGNQPRKAREHSR